MTLVKVNNPINRSIEGMMKEIFNEFPTALSKTFREDVLHFPPVNITEMETAYLLEMAAPGFEKDDFKIKLDGKLLSISTEKKEETQSTNEKLIRKEFSYKAFSRSFTSDDKIDMEHINAKYENGVLSLELPKKENSKTAAKEINIQ